MREIKQLSELKENWDGYGAIPVYPEIIDRACVFAATLNCEPTDVFANPNGTVSLEWETPRGLLQIEFGKVNYSCFLKQPNTPTVLENGYEPDISKMQDYLERLKQQITR